MSQYIHMLSNNNISMPTDLWVPATSNIKPMKSHQYAVGAFYTLKDVANFSVEGYYKTMDNLLEYKDGSSFMGASTNWEDKVSMGRGVATASNCWLNVRLAKQQDGWATHGVSPIEYLTNPAMLSTKENGFRQSTTDDTTSTSPPPTSFPRR